jgi:hypothetical protein
MIRLPPPLFRKRPTPPPTEALTLLSATIVDYSESDAIVELVFDTTAADPLVGIESADYTKWTARIEGLQFVGSSPLESAAFNTVMLYLGNAGDAAGLNILNYAAGPSDIEDAQGRKLAAIDGYPI